MLYCQNEINEGREDIEESPISDKNEMENYSKKGKMEPYL